MPLQVKIRSEVLYDPAGDQYWKFMFLIVKSSRKSKTILDCPHQTSLVFERFLTEEVL
jgi:hypothetical protein